MFVLIKGQIKVNNLVSNHLLMVLCYIGRLYLYLYCVDIRVIHHHGVLLAVVLSRLLLESIVVAFRLVIVVFAKLFFSSISLFTQAALLIGIMVIIIDIIHLMSFDRLSTLEIGGCPAMSTCRVDNYQLH